MSGPQNIRYHAKNIASALFDTERSIETSITNSNEILTRISTANSNIRTTVYHGQDSLEALVQLMVTLTQARRQAAILHSTLSGLKCDFGLGGLEFGPIGKPVDRVISSPVETLRAV